MKKLPEALSQQNSPGALLRQKLLYNHFFNSAYGSIHQADFNTMGMAWGIGQYILYNARSKLATSLILLLDDLNLPAWYYILALLAIHYPSHSLSFVQLAGAALPRRASCIASALRTFDSLSHVRF
jgi:hypothetical protein